MPVYDGQDQILDPSISRFRSMAVVANSGTLKGSGLGEEIDRAEAVVRMNAAPVQGWEEDVGTKTTFRFINGLLQKGKTLDYTSTPRNWLQRVENEDLILMPVNKRSSARARELIGDSNTVREFCADFDNYINNGVKDYIGKVPSTGVLSSVFAEYVAESVWLFGFGHHQEPVDQRHYWEDWDDSHDASHNWMREKAFLDELQDSRDGFKINEYSQSP